MGSNIEGVLGHSEISMKHLQTPSLIKTLKDIKQVSAGKLHSLALDHQGKVFGWGTTTNGAIGVRITSSQYCP